MIAPLRRRHRWVIPVLAVVVPVLYVVALAARPDHPAAPPLPAELDRPMPGQVESEEADLFEHPITTRIRTGRDAVADAAWWVELSPREPLAKPEVLVYWSAAPSGGGQLPADAYLLGALAGTRARAYALPVEALGRPGRLWLYSLGHQEVVGSAELQAIGTPPPPPEEVPGPEGGEDSPEVAS